MLEASGTCYHCNLYRSVDTLMLCNTYWTLALMQILEMKTRGRLKVGHAVVMGHLRVLFEHGQNVNSAFLIV